MTAKSLRLKCVSVGLKSIISSESSFKWRWRNDTSWLNGDRPTLGKRRQCGVGTSTYVLNRACHWFQCNKTIFVSGMGSWIWSCSYFPKIHFLFDFLGVKWTSPLPESGTSLDKILNHLHSAFKFAKALITTLQQDGRMQDLKMAKNAEIALFWGI